MYDIFVMRSGKLEVVSSLLYELFRKLKINYNFEIKFEIILFNFFHTVNIEMTQTLRQYSVIMTHIDVLVFRNGLFCW